MSQVYVFIAAGRFRGEEEMRRFVHPSYTVDGDAAPSPFMREVGLGNYEPGCIEIFHAHHVVPVRSLLQGASYGEQWLPGLPIDHQADAAVCVFSPNTLADPGKSSLVFVGVFDVENQRVSEFDELGFLTTLGRELCTVLAQETDILDASGSDCYSALTRVIKPPVKPESLAALSQGQLAELAASFNLFFETQQVTPTHIAKGVAAVLRHWPARLDQ